MRNRDFRIVRRYKLERVSTLSTKLKEGSQRVLRRLVILLATLILVVGGVVGGLVAPAQAATGNILPPFDLGQTWNICQGYDNPGVTHTGTSTYGLDLTGAGCDNSASGRNVRASLSGTVAYYQGTYGNLCINVGDGRSYTLTHIDSTITSGTVTAGQLVGTVAAPGSRGNNGVAHIHFQMWSTSNCYSSSGIPFDAAHNAQICGAPDLTASGSPGTGNGTWSGTSFTGQSCGEPPPPDGDGDGIPDSSDSCPTIFGPASNFGCPHQTIQMVGDVNNDGYDDAVTLYRKDDGSINVQRFPGSTNGLGSPVLDQFLSTWSWSSTKVGGLSDVNGDGYADLVVFHQSGAGGVNLWRLSGSATGLQAPVLDQYLPDFAWEDIKVGGLNDVNGDGLSDLAFFYERGDGSTNVWRTPGTVTGLTGGMFLDQIRTSWVWNDIKSGGLADINNDGRADLVALYRAGNGTVNVWRFPANSSGLQTPWLDQNLEGHAWIEVKAGGIDDVNGDGYGDVVIFYRTGTGAVNVWRLPSNSNGIQDTGASPDRSLTSWGWNYIKSTGLGDVNGDGYADAVVLYKTGTGAVNTWRLPGSSTVLQSASTPDVTPLGWAWNNIRA